MPSQEINYVIIHFDVLSYNTEKARELLLRLINPSRHDVVILFSRQKTKELMQHELEDQFNAPQVATSSQFISRGDFEKKMTFMPNATPDDKLMAGPIKTILHEITKSEKITVKNILFIDHEPEHINSANDQFYIEGALFWPLCTDTTNFDQMANFILALPFFQQEHSIIYRHQNIPSIIDAHKTIYYAHQHNQTISHSLSHLTYYPLTITKSLIAMGKAKCELFFQSKNFTHYNECIEQYKVALSLYTTLGDDSNAIICLLKLIKIESFRFETLTNAAESETLILQYTIQLAEILIKMGSILTCLISQKLITQAQQQIGTIQLKYNTAMNQKSGKSNNPNLETFKKHIALFVAATNTNLIQGKPETPNALYNTIARLFNISADKYKNNIETLGCTIQ